MCPVSDNSGSCVLLMWGLLRISSHEPTLSCVSMRRCCLYTWAWGVAANTDMLTGVEGHAACKALAKALASSTSLGSLNISREWWSRRVQRSIEYICVPTCFTLDTT